MASRPIDERIVIMRLENEQFKAKAAETVSLFGKLKQALGNVGNTRLDKVSNDISNIEKASNRFSLQGMATAVDTISSRFSTLGVVATTALMNITNKAVDAGMSLAKSLTLDQVTSGFSEYETKIGSIGTVLSNTEWAGTSLEDVKRVLEELNVYADNTVYSFGQMTENIGRFTAAGVSIDDSATAIKGLSNLAAASGSDVNQLNTAMYQMSQSMAAGTFNLMDWNSLVNAGMGGKKTQDALLETAKAMGVNVNMADGFRNSISDGWLSAEVFLETMKKFGNDKSMTEAATAVRTFSGMMDSLKESIGSGWATTWEIIFGDFEQATKFWTALSTVVTGFFSESSKSRNNMLQNLADSGALEDFGLGIRNILIPIGQLFKSVGDGFKKAFPPKTTAQLKSMTEGFKNLTSGLKMSDKTVSKITTVFQGVFSVFSSGIEIAKRVGSALLNLIPKGVGGSILDVLVKFAEFSIALNQSLKDGNAFTGWIDSLGSVFGTIGDVIGKVVVAILNFSGSVIGNLGEAIGWIIDKLAPLGQIMKEAFGDVGGEDILGVGMVAAIFLVIKKITGAFDTFSDLFDNIGDIFGNAGDMFESLGDTLNAFATGIKIANLVLIAGAITLIAVALKMLEGIDSEDMSRGIMALAVSMGLMMAALAVISKFNIVGGLKASATLLALAGAVTIMASALKTLSDIDPEGLKTGITGLVVVIGALVAAVVAISKFSGKIATSSVALLALATSVRILADAVEELSAINGKDLAKSVTALGVIFAELAIFLMVANGSKLSVTSAVGLIAVGAAIQIMIDAIQKIAGIDIPSLAKGLTTIALLLTAIAAFSMFAGGPQMMLAGAGILLIAGAINALVPAVTTLGNMTWEELVKGLGGMALALAAVAGAGILASGAIGGAVAITVMAVALNLLVGPIERLATLTWGEIAKGLTTVALAIALLAGASLLLTPAIPPMLGLGAALVVMGVAMLAAGAGIALFGTGLATLSTLTAASVASIVAGLALLLKSFAELVPGAIDFVVKVGVALLEGIQSLVPKLITVVVELVMALLRTLDEHIPEFLQVGVSVVVKIIEGITEALPKLVTAALNLIVSLIETLAGAIRDNGPMIISAVMELIASILILLVEAGGQVINSLFGWIPGVTDAVSTIGSTAEQYLMDSFGADVIGAAKGKDFSSALSGTSGEAKTAGELIANAGKDGASGIEMSATGEDFGMGFANGLASSGVISTAISKAKELANAAINAITGFLDINSPSRVTHALGEHTGDGFANGIEGKKKSVAEAVFGWMPGMQSATDKINTQAAKSGEKVGTSAVAGVGKGIDKTAPKVAKKAKTTAKKTAKDVASEAMTAFKSKMEDLEYKFEMGEIDNAKLLKGVQSLKKAYAKYPEVVKEASRKIKKIEDDMAKEVIDRENKIHNKRKDLISERKYYNELSLKQELEAWERMQARHAEGTEKRKEADREVYRLKKEIHGQMVSLNDEYFNKVQEINQKLIDDELALNQKYEDALSSRTQSIRSGLGGLFDQFTTDSEVSGIKLLDNLRSQLNGMMNWSRDMKSLASKGIDEGLVAELREMGPKAASEIAALNGLTHLELQEYSSSWKLANELARTEAMGELQGMKEDTAKQIEELRKDAKTQLEMYKTEWLTKLKEIRTGVPDQFDGLDASMESIGKDAMKGFQKGLANMKGPLVKEAKAIAASVDATIRQTLKVKSPSRLLMETGEHTGDGLAIGLKNSGRAVMSSAKAVALKASDTIRGLMDGIMSSEEDNEIRIKAVVDYDGLNSDLVKMGASTLVPNLDYTQSVASTLKQPVKLAPEPAVNPTNPESGVKDQIGGLVASINSLLDKPQPIQLFVDGSLMTEVVSRHQYSNRMLGAMTKGV